MSKATSKKDGKRQLREGDRIADFSVVKTLGHGGYGDIYLVKSRIHPDYLTRFAMKIEYPNKDNNSNRNTNAPSKNQNNQNNSNQNDNNSKNKEKGSDIKNSNNDNDNIQKGISDNDNDNKNANADSNANSKQENESNNNENKENNKKDENGKNNKNKNRTLLRKSHLYIERSVLNAVQDSPYFPRYISYGQTSIFRFLVMECFGPSLSTLKHVLPTGKFSLSSSLRIGIQMLRAIHAFHQHGFVHRDIKPSNFLIAPSLSYPIILIDFGLARVFNTEKDKTKDNANGDNTSLSNSNINLSALSSEQLNNSSANLNQNQSPKAKFGFAGTTKYASINAHENKELGRRDDLFSWFYSLIEIAAGSLPWSSQREKDDIYQEKKNADLDAFIAKHSLPKQLCSIRILIESYSRTDEPDYDLIESFLDEAMRQHGSSWEDKYEWQRIDDESMRELSSIPLKPPKGDRYIPNKHLPEPVLPSKRKLRKHKDFSDEEIEIEEINKIASKSKQRRHTSAIANGSDSKKNRVRSTTINENTRQTNLRHYAPQIDNQGKHSYFSSSDEKERYGHYGSDQLFSNSSSQLPSYRMSYSNKKVAPSPISQMSNNNVNNDSTNINEKNTSTSTRRKYVTTARRNKGQRKRRNSDPRQPPQISKHHTTKGVNNEENDSDNQENDNENSEKDNDDEGVPLAGKGYHNISTSNSIIFISTHHKNDDDNDNNNNSNGNSSSNSMYYTYHSYSSGDDLFNNIENYNNNSNNNSYYYNNSSNYTDSDSGEFPIGEKSRYSLKRKNLSCPAMEPKIDRKINNEKKNNKNCLIQ